jgi:hypothetical protein
VLDPLGTAIAGKAAGIHGVAPVGNTLRATLITSASLPTSPSSPNYLIDIPATLVGLALGIGTAALRDHLDDRFRTPFGFEAQTGAPVLALIPAFHWVTLHNASGLAMVRNPDPVIAEAYRGLRTRARPWSPMAYYSGARPSWARLHEPGVDRAGCAH